MWAIARGRTFGRLSEWVVVWGFFLALYPATLNGGSESLSSLDILASELKTPEALERFMNKNFIYLEDRVLFRQEEYWQTPEEMLQRKRGDCEDFAAFAEAILKRNGYKVFLFSAFWDENAHTVAVFESRGRWRIFDIDRLRSMKGNSVRDLGNDIHRAWSFLGIMRREGHLGIISRKFRNQKSLESDLFLL